MIAEHDAAPHLRIVQKALAQDITIRTHSELDYETAVKTSEFLFGNGDLSFLANLDHEAVLEVFDGVPQFQLEKEKLNAGINILDLLAVETQVFSSKGEARKMLQGGGVSLNREKLNDIELVVNTDQLINGKYLIAQRGKKNYYLITVE
ncbi:Tyrosine--tRNA ligase [Sphingobacterium daejeonense]|nr:Tyrosine--tRNA ligase [Sphingobacterium daejeonense]